MLFSAVCFITTILLISAKTAAHNSDLALNTNTVTTTPIKSMNAFDNSHTALVLFDAKTNSLSGWDHTQNFADEFVGLKLNPQSYEVERKPDNPNNIYSTTLVKKLADWQHQHGNSIIADITEQDLLFSNVAGIALVLKINSLQSNLPTSEQMTQAYGDKVSAMQLATLDDANVYLSLAVFGLSSEPEKITFNADYLLKLDAPVELDQ